MSNNLEKFKALFGVGARANLFRVVFTLPTAVVGPGATGERLTAMVKDAQFPTKTFAPIEIPWRGMKAKYAGDPEFTEWQCTFWNTVDFGAWATIYAWSELCHTTISNQSNDPIIYKAPVIIQQLDDSGEPAHTVTLIGAWPSELGEIALSMESESTIEEFACTFTYDYWTVTPNVL